MKTVHISAPEAVKDLFWDVEDAVPYKIISAEQAYCKGWRPRQPVI